MATRMQQRRGTAAQWTAANPILAAGEIGFETDTVKFKVGNGSSAWASLKYFTDAESILGGLSGIDLPATLDTLNELAAAMGDDPAFLTSIASNLSAHSSDTTSIHGIANTALLATSAEVATAKGQAISDAATAADTKISTHTADTTDIHGIVNTALLETMSGAQAKVDTAIAAEVTNRDTAISTHNSDQTMVHGITDTAQLALKSETAAVQSALTSEITNRDSAISAHNSDTTNVHGIANTASIAMIADITAHSNDTTDIHGIANTANLATLDDIATATVDQSLLAGTGIDWNSVNERFDIDSTVATKTYADSAVSTHDSDTTNVHGIADTSALALTATVNTALGLKAPLASPTFTGTVSGITKTMVGLGNVDNTSDTAKPVSTAAQTALDLKAPLASPALTGVPTAPTATAGTSTTQVATTAFVGTAVSNLVASAPAALDTLNELATALGNDASFSTTITNSIATKSPIASPTFTGTVTAPAITATGLITASASGVAFTDGTQTKEGVASRTPIVQKTAAYTLSALTERDSLIEVSSATGVTITIPTNTAVAYPIGTSIDILQTGAGQVTIAPVDGTVTVNATPGLKLRTTWSSATLFKRAANTWVVFGDLTA
jgi:hypothetical protein